jgi:hypothetical protein
LAGLAVCEFRRFTRVLLAVLACAYGRISTEGMIRE